VASEELLIESKSSNNDLAIIYHALSIPVTTHRESAPIMRMPETARLLDNDPERLLHVPKYLIYCDALGFDIAL
jgi:hypothetical protein